METRGRTAAEPLAPLGRGLAQAGEMAWLLAVILKSAVRRPRGYWGDVRDQMYLILRLCWLPMVISTLAFGFGAPGLQALNFFSLFGIPERLGSFIVTGGPLTDGRPRPSAGGPGASEATPSPAGVTG